MLNIFVVVILCLSWVLAENIVPRQVFGGIEAVRLVNGPNARIGRLEVRSQGVWGTVCDDGFRHAAANAACHSLGFSGNSGFAIRAGTFPIADNETLILLDDVRCLGNESSLNECSHRPIGENNCRHGEDVGVGCGFEGIENIRLMGAQNAGSGRLEVMSEGVWGVVCQHHFVKSAANVVCRSLGFPENAGFVSPPRYGTGYHMYPPHPYLDALPILLADVSCFGNETSIAECEHSPIGQNNCFPGEYVDMQCALFPEIDQVRLVNGSNLHEGRVEVFRNGTWGTVCDDRFGYPAASVVCRMLGFEPLGAEPLIRAHFGQGTGPIFLDDVVCVGHEITLNNCGYRVNHNCFHSEDVGVRCREYGVSKILYSSKSDKTGGCSDWLKEL